MVLKNSLRDIILGGQDGLVNVLGVVLGVSAATSDLKIIIVSGLAATFAESISMGAVAYTSTEAEQSKYLSDKKKERDDVEKNPSEEREDVRKVFADWGFEGELLKRSVDKITSDKELWTKFMMSEELKEEETKAFSPRNSMLVVGLSSLLGSLIPLAPFFLISSISTSVYTSAAVSAAALFIIGVVKAKQTIGDPLKSGLKITAIGMASAIVGFIIGKLVGGVSI